MHTRNWRAVFRGRVEIQNERPLRSGRLDSVCCRNQAVGAAVLCLPVRCVGRVLAFASTALPVACHTAKVRRWCRFWLRLCRVVLMSSMFCFLPREVFALCAVGGLPKPLDLGTARVITFKAVRALLLDF